MILSTYVYMSVVRKRILKLRGLGSDLSEGVPPWLAWSSNPETQVLGIEATRGALLNELRLVISFDGSYVNYRHLSVPDNLTAA